MNNLAQEILKGTMNDDTMDKAKDIVTQGSEEIFKRVEKAINDPDVVCENVDI